MQFDENWPRWIMASCAAHFTIDGTNYFVEGFERDTDKKAEFVEFRLDGPYISQLPSKSWELNVEINILISTAAAANAYRQQELQGRVVSKFLDCLEVFKVGNNEPDDGTLLGCLKIQMKGREKIIVTNFGQLKADVRLFQSSIEGHYKMILD